MWEAELKKQSSLLYLIGITLIILCGIGWGVSIVFQIIAASTGGQGIVETLVLASLVLPVLGCLGMAVLVLKVVLDRLNNKEDDYYSKNVER
ncbi:MAG: hypothetical protein CMK07_11545 [Ponticaulis sp.]|nr:hypothetical protein [Ponticaulis sp.]